MAKKVKPITEARKVEIARACRRIAALAWGN